MEYERQQRVLILDKNYCPLSICSVYKAFSMVFSERAKIVEEHESRVIKGIDWEMKIPTVIVLNNYIINYKHHKVRFSKKNVFCRDNYTCVYCNNKLPRDKLTIDHIVPKSRTKRAISGWKNCITACKKCNEKKANKTPKEAGMRMYFDPKKPSYAPDFKIRSLIKNSHDSWFKFLGDRSRWQ